jgi:hypothetical protein
MAALIESNKKQIAENRSNIFSVECAVMANRSKAYMARSVVQENQALIIKNYQAAFMGNRQLINQNTDDLFRNRQAILRHIKASNPVEINFKEAMINKAKLDFLEHRSGLNEKVLDISLKMAAVNAMMIEINSAIMVSAELFQLLLTKEPMLNVCLILTNCHKIPHNYQQETNEKIVEFNTKCIEENSAFLKEGTDLAAATPESNAAMIKENTERLHTIMEKAGKNKSKINVVLGEAERNRTAIEANSAAIIERRSKVHKNSDKIAANQVAIAEFVGEF